MFQHRILQREIGIHPLEATIFVFRLPQPLQVGGLQPAVLGLSLVVGGGADPVVSPDLVDGAAGIGLLEDGHNLGFGKLRLAH